MEHELKTDTAVFQQSWDGIKTFELRLNDRDFSVGDTLLLRETVYNGMEMKDGKPFEYTGRAIEQEVCTVLHGPIYGLADGWVIMSINCLVCFDDYDVFHHPAPRERKGYERIRKDKDRNQGAVD